jgi:hypothetical protein
MSRDRCPLSHELRHYRGRSLVGRLICGPGRGAFARGCLASHAIAIRSHLALDALAALAADEALSSGVSDLTSFPGSEEALRLARCAKSINQSP